MNRLISALGFFLMLAGCSAQPAAQEAPLAGAAIGGDFVLTDENGERFSSDQLAGRYQILYFGYTYCPDVCPVDVANVMRGLAAAEKADPALAGKIQPLFITIDPARDTPAALRQFTDSFHPRLIGLTGSDGDIAKVAKAHLIQYQKRETPGFSEYLMDHSRQTYLMGPKGEPIALLSHDGTPQQIADEIRTWVR
jgi:protein SCO1/2